MPAEQSLALPGASLIGSVLQPFWEAPARREEKVKIKIPPLFSEPQLLPRAALAGLLGLESILLLL